MTFFIRLAGRNIRIQSLYEAVFSFCESYVINDPGTVQADIDITVHAEDIENEAAVVRRENSKLGFSFEYAPQVLEAAAVHRKIATAMTAFDTFVMHGTVISTSGTGYMITASSGTGKTTRAKLWVKHIPDSQIVNGDKPLIRITDDAAYAYGTPWCGKEGMNVNTCVPLRSLLILERSDGGNTIAPMRASDAYPVLLRQTYFPVETAARLKTFSLLQRLTDNVSIFHFCSEPTAEAVLTAWQATRSADR